MRLKPYSEYKNSSIEWLGAVPVDWDIVSIKWMSPVQRGASPRPIDDQKYFDEDGEYAWVRIADVSSSDGVLRGTTQRLSELGSSLSVKIYPNELFVSIAGTVGKPCISAIKACIHDGFVYFPKLKIPAIFLYRIFEAGTCYGGLGKFGTQLNLNTDTIGSIRIALPLKNEIDSIVKFLDRETGKLDTLISKQEHLIELLQEKRQAIISHAVTKGLNPDAKMKDSGVEWLGMVPEHWTLIKISRVFHIAAGGDLKTEFFSEECNDLHSYPIYTNSTKQGAVYGFTSKPYFPANSITVTGRGDIGFAVYRENEYDAIIRLLVLTPKKNHSCKYSAYFINSMLRFSEGSTAVNQLSTQQISPHLILCPPDDERISISYYLDQENSRIDTLIDKAKRSIELAKEHRTALISAAVTGKIDVRESA